MPDFTSVIRFRDGTRRSAGRSRQYGIDINKNTFYCFLIVLVSFLGCEKNIPVPQHLIGEWKTSSPQYADRYLKIAEHSLVFGIGRGEKLSHDIDKVNVKKENGETIYIIHYRDPEGDKWSLTLIHNPVSGDTIRLKNNNVIWNKVRSESP